jgi:UDP-N-acetyl-D-glucosamine/UDP-N-acetyl-D-galactosamine dehydrogenase
MMISLRSCRIGVIGLGDVGLPLAVEFGQRFDTVGFDVNAKRIKALQAGRDATLETTRQELQAATRLPFTANPAGLKPCRVFIVTVPTPIDEHKRPDLGPLRRASEAVGRMLKRGDVVVYESTVYPGCTEEDCVPILEKSSRLRFNRGFFTGYSPERINPGDRKHRLANFRKITSGSTLTSARSADCVNALTTWRC